MPSADVFKVLLVLLPGFVTTGIIRALTVSSEDGESDKVVRALSYSFLNYAIFSYIRSAKPVVSYLDPSVALLSRPVDVAWLAGIAIAMGCIVSAYKNNDGHRILRLIRLTYRSSRSDIWHDSLVEGGKFHVVVTLKDGRRIFGWPVRYSDNIKDPALFLEKAAWLSEGEDGEIIETPTGNKGILLLAPTEIASVEFVEEDDPKVPKKWWKEKIKRWMNLISSKIGSA